MKQHVLPLMLIIAALAGVAVAQKIPATAEIPNDLPAKAKAELVPWRAKLEDDRSSLRNRAAEQNKNCNPAPPDAAAKAKCRDGQKEFNDEAQNFTWDVEEFNASVHGYIVIAAMNASAKTLPDWSDKERKRLDTALNALDRDGNKEKSRAEIQSVWADMLARGDALKADADKGAGPKLFGSGTQTNYSDCAIFALANASGQPYGVVAARAAKLMADGKWRDEAERSNPQAAIEKRGLMGGEVVMLAEALGQVKIVKSDDFAKTLIAGHAVMINVFPSGGTAHEVVLSKTFTHGGETWFEMMDSNRGPLKRLYLSKADLMKILKETGVTYAPEEGSVVRPLK